MFFSRQASRAAVRAASAPGAVTVRAASARSFAAAAPAPGSSAAGGSQPPIAVFGLDGTYASAL
ncbi:hypothetical protein E4U41_005002, partial [Claviceps citrina]